MNKLRIAIAGAGNIAQNAHLPVYASRDDVQVIAVCDLNIERARACAEKFGIPNAYSSIDEMLACPDIDIVDICVWNGSHKDVAVKAARAGKHILCEKPMAWNLDSALEMERVVKETGVTFMLAVMSRFGSEAQLLKQIIEEGKLGDIYYAKTADIRRRGTPLGWFTDVSKSGGGPVIDIGIHCIDRTWYLMGKPKPVRISAMTHNKIGDYKTKGVSRWIALDSDVTAFDTEDSAEGVIHFENGAAMLFEVSWALNAKPGGYTVVCGDKGGAELNPMTVYGEECGYLTDNTPTTQGNNPYGAEIDHFLDCVRTGKTPIAPASDGVTVQRMLQGIYDSAKAKKEVTL